MDLQQDVSRELERWSDAGMRARIWWRDDDAVCDTPQLRRLLAIARTFGLAPAIAVVPERADDSLVLLQDDGKCCVWQHGWAHRFYTDGEFGEGRQLGPMVDDALAGQRKLDALFGGEGWQRVFVPPNHSLSIAFKSLAPSLGYLGISAGVPLTRPLDHVYEVNAVMDLMDWPQGRLLSPGDVHRLLLDQLQLRRLSQTPISSPIGLLTHHLVFNEEAWTDVSRLFAFLASAPAVEFLGANTLFPGSRESATATPPSVKPVDPDRQTSDVTVVVTSCGRPDLLTRTLDTFIEHNTYPIRELIVVEDGESSLPLQARYGRHNFRWITTGRRIGQMAAIDMAYRLVDTDYIFHCEDDWEFYAPGFIEKSRAVLTNNPSILQMWIRALTDTNNSTVIEHPLVAGGVRYRIIQPGLETEEWGTWHGFALNPGLRRRRDYELLGSFARLDPLRQKKSYEVEREASEFYWVHGFLAAILADNDGAGYVRHVGWGRRVEWPIDSTPEQPARQERVKILDPVSLQQSISSATTADPVALRDAIVSMAASHIETGNIQQATEALATLESATIDEKTLQLTDPFLPAVAAGRQVVAAFDPLRIPGRDEVVVIYGNYPQMFGNVIVNNPIRRHASDFWKFSHDRIEYDQRWSGVDALYIINADSRQDRLDAVLRDLAWAKAPFQKITRVAASVPDPLERTATAGALGCLRSHIATLERIRAAGHRHSLVLEDDFTFTSDLDRHLTDLAEFVRRNYDYWVCLIATSKYGAIVPMDDLLSTSFQECTNTGGYLISREGVEQVLPVFEAAVKRLQVTGDCVANAADRCWSVLQPSGKFLVFRRKFGFQAASFSDIERTIARYFD